MAADPPAQRLERLRAALRAAGEPAAVLGDPATLRYLTGVELHPEERLAVLVVPADGQATLVHPALDAEHAAHASAAVATIGWTDNDGPMAALRAAFDAIPAAPATAAAEKDHLTVRAAEQVAAAGGLTAWSDATPLVTALRTRKDADELALMRASAAIASACVDAVPELLRPGVAEHELAQELRVRGLALGAEEMAFAPTVLFGAGSAPPHGRPGATRLRDDDIVLIDFGVMHGGYASDITRMFAVGAPPADFADLYALVRAAHGAAVAASRPGATCGEVDRAARAVIAAAGHGERFMHGTGHGIGLHVHEPPRVADGRDEPLAAGVTFTIEPGIYLPGRFGIRLEDTIAVTDGEAELLTTSTRELVVVAP